MLSLRRAAAAAALAAVAVALPVAAQPGTAPGPAQAAGPGTTPVVWTAALPAEEGFDRLSAFDNGVFYAQYGQGYAKSTDYGATWSTVQGPDDETGTSGMLRWTSPQRGFAVVGRATPALTDPVTHERCPVGVPWFNLDVTVDGGQHWAPACTPVAPATQLLGHLPNFTAEGLYVSHQGSHVLVVGDTGAACKNTSEIHPVLFTTSDTGRHWRQVTLPGGYAANLLGYAIRDPRHVVVFAGRVQGSCAGYSSGAAYAFVTTDGVHYKRVFRCPGVRYCASGAWVSANRVLIGLDDGQLFVSNNKGRTFFKGALLRESSYDPLIATGQLDPRILWVQALSFSDATHGFASTRGSGTWRTTDGGIRWVQENSPECIYYPFGVGDIAAADRDHGITGGPRSLDVRQPGNVELGCLTPQSGGPQLAMTDTVVAVEHLPGSSPAEGRIDRFGRTTVIAD